MHMWRNEANQKVLSLLRQYLPYLYAASSTCTYPSCFRTWLHMRGIQLQCTSCVNARSYIYDYFKEFETDFNFYANISACLVTLKLNRILMSCNDKYINSKQKRHLFQTPKQVPNCKVYRVQNKRFELSLFYLHDAVFPYSYALT